MSKITNDGLTQSGTRSVISYHKGAGLYKTAP